MPQIEYIGSLEKTKPTIEYISPLTKQPTIEHPVSHRRLPLTIYSPEEMSKIQGLKGVETRGITHPAWEKRAIAGTPMPAREAIRVLGTLATGMAGFLASFPEGAEETVEQLKESGLGGINLKKIRKRMQRMQALPEKLKVLPEEELGIRTIQIAAYPFHAFGQYIVDPVKERVAKVFTDSPHQAEQAKAGVEIAGDIALLVFSPKLATSLKALPGSIKASTWYRQRTIPERGLIALTVEDLRKAGVPDGRIARMKPEYFRQELKKRMPEPIVPTPIVRPEVKPRIKPISKKLEPLVQETRKYKSAEEFIKDFPDKEEFFLSRGLKWEKSLKGFENLAGRGKKFAKYGNWFIEDNPIYAEGPLGTKVRYHVHNTKGEVITAETAIPKAMAKIERWGGITKSQLVDFYNQAVKGAKPVLPIEEIAPEVSRAETHGLRWDKITPAQQASIKQWVKEGREGLPEVVAEARMPGIPGRIRPPYIEKVEKKVSSAQVASPLRDFETFTNLRIKNKDAIGNLMEISKDLGITIKLTAKGWADGKFAVTRTGIIRGIEIKDINDFVSLGHELGHGIDFTIVGGRKYLPTLSGRIGAGFEKQTEKALITELKRISDYVRPFDRKIAKRGYSAYRNRRIELFADWVTLYLTEPQKAKVLAPTFTEGMERHHSKIIEIKDKLIIRPEVIEVYDLPVTGIKKAVNNLTELFTKIEPLPQVRVGKSQNTVLQKLGAKAANIALLPFWYGVFHKNPAVKAIWNAVQNNITYFYYGEMAKARKAFNWGQIRRMPASSHYKITRALYIGNDKGVKQYFEPGQLKTMFKMTEDEINAYQRIVEGLKRGTERLIEERKIKTGYYKLSPERQKELDPVIKAQIDKLGGYIPIDRPGKWFVYGEFIEAGKAEPILSANWRKSDAIKEANLFAEMGYKNVGVYEPHRLPPAFWANYKKLGIYDIDNVIEAAGIDNTLQGIVELREYVMKSGWDKHFIKRKWTPGFKRTFDNLMMTLENFTESSIRRLAKAKAYDAATEHLKKIDPRKEPETYTYMSNYIKGALFSSHAEFYAIRNGIYAYFLSFSPTYLFQQLIQNLFTLLPEIANHVKGGLKAELIFAKGIIDSARYLGSRILKRPSKLDKLTMQLLDRAVDERLISGMYTEMVLGINPIKSSRAQNIMGILGIASEAWNRLHICNSAIAIARKYYRMTDPEQIYTFMKEMIHKTAYPYGRTNIPNFVAQTGNLRGAVKTALVFKMTHLNYLYQLADVIGKGTFGAKWRMLSARAFWMGLTRILPFGGLTIALTRLLFDKDIPTEIKKKLGKEHTLLPEVVLKGAPALANMDFTDILEIGTLAQPDFDIAGQIFGPAYGVADRLDSAYRLMQQGEITRSLARASPRTLSNILTALEWKEKGVRIKRDVYVLPSKFELVQKTLGFTPARVKEQYQIRNMERDLKKDYNKLSRRIQERLYEKLVTPEGWQLGIPASKGGREALKRLLGNYYEDIMEHNKKVSEALTIWYLTSDTPIAVSTMDRVARGLTVEPADVTRWINETLKAEEIKEQQKKVIEQWKR